jgi:hypothetical protein
MKEAQDAPPITDRVLRHLTECAHAWESDTCLLGNVTAKQLQAFCAELTQLRAEKEGKIVENLAKIVEAWEDPHNIRANDYACMCRVRELLRAAREAGGR